MKYILVGYLLTFNGSMNVESYAVSSAEVCSEYREKIAFITEKTRSGVRRAAFFCVPQEQFMLAAQ